MIAPIHPGEVLKKDFMEPYGLSANQLARRIGVPPNRVSDIVRGRRNITGDTALRLSRLFGVSATFWMALQAGYELRTARIARGRSIKAVRPLSRDAHAD